MSDQFFYFYPHIFGHISSILVFKQVLDNIFQSIIVTYNFFMIPHFLIFSFNLAHIGVKQNPTSLQEALQRSDENSKTTFIIKSTLGRSFPMKKHQKYPFWNIALFTRFNLTIALNKIQRKISQLPEKADTEADCSPPLEPQVCPHMSPDQRHCAVSCLGHYHFKCKIWMLIKVTNGTKVGHSKV